MNIGGSMGRVLMQQTYHSPGTVGGILFYFYLFIYLFFFFFCFSGFYCLLGVSILLRYFRKFITLQFQIKWWPSAQEER